MRTEIWLDALCIGRIQLAEGLVGFAVVGRVGLGRGGIVCRGVNTCAAGEGLGVGDAGDGVLGEGYEVGNIGEVFGVGRLGKGLGLGWLTTEMDSNQVGQ